MREFYLGIAGFIAVSLVFPAVSAEQARMADASRPFVVDLWFLFPIWLTDRLSAGELWAIFFATNAVLLSVPWWLARGRRRKAKVEASRCNACTQCSQDCPYGAIELVERDDDRPYATVARVNAARCVGCGLCVGGCDPGAIELPRPTRSDVHKRLDSWLAPTAQNEAQPAVMFACSGSAAAELEVDLQSGRSPKLPDVRIVPVPCAGWVHPLLVERALRAGAREALVVSCGSSCRYRDGANWTEERLQGKREPKLRSDKVDAERVSLAHFDRSQRRTLLKLVSGRGKVVAASTVSRWRRLIAALAVVVAVSVMLVFGSHVHYQPPLAEGSELLISFRHPGLAECRPPTPEELAERPPHMQPDKICSRERLPVRLQVSVDGVVRVEQSYAPGGVFSDGNSGAVESLRLPEGSHHVAVAIGETSDANDWKFSEARTLEFDSKSRRVVLFDRVEGFSWH